MASLTKEQLQAKLEKLQSLHGAGSVDDATYQELLGQIKTQYADIKRNDQITAETGVQDPQAVIDRLNSPSKEGLPLVGKVLDYPGGIARTAAAGALGGATQEELKQAAKGNPLSGQELMKRAGVKSPGWQKGLGLATEVVVDPFNIVGLASLGSKAGRGLYKAGMKQLDMASMKAGTKPVSDVLLKEGVYGSEKAIMEQAADVGNKLLAAKDAALETATKAGKTVDLVKPYQELYYELTKVVNGTDELAAQAASKVRETLGQQLERLKPKVVTDPIHGTKSVAVPVTPVEADAIKTSLYKNLPENVYNVMTRTKQGQQVVKDMARVTKEAVEKVAPEVKQINADLGSILSARKSMMKEAGKETTRNAVSSVDAAIAWLDPATALAKKAGDVSKTPGFRTTTGYFMNQLPEVSNAATGALLAPRAGMDIYEWLANQEQK
jgi:hypothetical protein